MFRAPEWSINARSPWALDVLAEEGFGVDASMAPVKLVGDVSYPRYPHIRNTPAGPITEMPPLVADRFGQVMPMGWGWGLRMSSPGRVLRTIAAGQSCGPAGHPDGASLGTRPEPAEGAPAAATTVRPLFSPARISHAAPRRAARNGFWPSGTSQEHHQYHENRQTCARCHRRALRPGREARRPPRTCPQPCESRSSMSRRGSALRVLDQAGSVPFPIAVCLIGSPARCRTGCAADRGWQAGRARVAHHPRAGRRAGHGSLAGRSPRPRWIGTVHRWRFSKCRWIANRPALRALRCRSRRPRHARIATRSGSRSVGPRWRTATVAKPSIVRNSAPMSICWTSRRRH